MFKKMNKKVMFSILVLLGFMFILPLMSASVATLTNPVKGGNYTLTPFTIAVTVPAGCPDNVTNVTCYYNSSGGEATKFLIRIVNTSNEQLSFTDTVTLTTDSRTYNISCQVSNATTLNYTIPGVNAVTIEGGLPATTLSIESSTIGIRGNELVQWTATDSLSGINTVVTTLTSPDTARCTTKTYTDTNGIYTFNDDLTMCTGTYTVLVTATDYSGNQKTSTGTFKVSSAGLSKSGSNTLGGAGKSELSQGQEINAEIPSNLPLGESGTNVAIIAILGIAGYYLLKKK